MAFLVTTFVFTTVGVVGQSMYPTLRNGERVLVPKWETWLVRLGFMEWRRGEIAILKPPEGTPFSTARFPFWASPSGPSSSSASWPSPGTRSTWTGGWFT